VWSARTAGVRAVGKLRLWLALGVATVAAFVVASASGVSGGNTITTIAGKGIAGFSGDDRPATAGRLADADAVALDGHGHVSIVYRKAGASYLAAKPARSSAVSIYAASGSGGGPSKLYRVSIARNGRDTALGTIRTIGGSSISAITDIALGGDADGRKRLYAVSWNQLYLLNQKSGVAQQVSAAVLARPVNINALVSVRNGTLLAAGIDGSVVKIDTATGRGVVIGSFGAGLGSSGDLIVMPSGRIFGTATGAGSDALVQVNPGTGKARRVGAIGFDQVYGLTVARGRLFGLTNTNPGCPAGGLIEINVSSGRGNLLRCLSFSAWGATAGAPPASPGAPPAAKLRTFVDRIEKLLMQSAAGRRALAAALRAGFNCSISPRTAGQRIASVVENRRGLLAQLGSLETPTQQAGTAVALLSRAMQRSIDADRYYRDGFFAVAPTSGCPRATNRNFKLAKTSDALATATKQRFVAAFNPLAKRFQRRVWSAGEF
jgi:hypothetical protein